MKKRDEYRFVSIDPRVTNISKVAPPLNISYISNAQKNQAGTSKWLRMVTSKPSVGVYGGLANPKKVKNAKSK